MEEMESHPRHCTDKEYERESEREEMEEAVEDNHLEYASEEEYQTPPMGVLQELCLIEDIPDCVVCPSSPHGCCLDTGGKNPYTEPVHAEYMVVPGLEY